MQLLLQYMCSRTQYKHNVRAAAQCVEVSWTSAFLLPRALTDVLFLLFVPSALRGVQHVTICAFQFARAFCRALVVFIKLERVPWFWVRKIGMVWGPRGVASPVPIIFASFDQLHSCTALLLSLSLILQQLRLSCWLRKQERNCERL